MAGWKTATMIELHHVGVTYGGGVVAVRDVSLGFRPGEFAVLLGLSGAGKSTVLRCLNGLVTPTAGRVIAEGIGDLAQPGVLRQHRRRSAMVFQQHQLIGRLSALRNVLTGRLAYHGGLQSILPLPRTDYLIALECLERVGLLDRALDRVDTLSGGGQQRVGIARALAQRPRLILADEPVASLDPTTALHVLGLLHAICKRDRIAAVVSLHQVQLAQEFADRVIGLAQGRVVFDGALRDLAGAGWEQIYASEPGARFVAAALPVGVQEVTSS